MRLGRLLSAIPLLAIGLVLWKHAQWVTSPENSSQDGTCSGIEEIVSQFLSVVFYLLSLLVLLKGIPFQQVIRFVEGGGDETSGQPLVNKADAGESRGPRPLHPSEDTTDLFE